MTRNRVVETNEGIQGEQMAETFDQFARFMRDKGWNGIDSMLASGIQGGDVLEIGAGPGYVGLELAKRLSSKSLTGFDVSSAMLRLARKNASEYGICAEYLQGNAMAMPFKDESFDSIISNGSLHEWENPVSVFDEIYRVLRTGGRYCITDLRRDVNPLKKAMVYLFTKPKQMRPGFVSSLNAAYTSSEIAELLQCSQLQTARVTNEFFGLCICGKK